LETVKKWYGSGSLCIRKCLCKNIGSISSRACIIYFRIICSSCKWSVELAHFYISVSSYSISDIDECLGSPRPCQHRCTNTPGSYTCSCNSCYTKVGGMCELRQCKIGGRCYGYGDENPSNDCQVKQSLLSDWFFMSNEL
jgi:hypothetical protein